MKLLQVACWVAVPSFSLVGLFKNPVNGGGSSKSFSQVIKWHNRVLDDNDSSSLRRPLVNRSEPFPRWSHDEGIDMSLLLDYIHGLVQNETTAFGIHTKNSDPRPFGETLYVVDDQGVHVSRALRHKGILKFIRGRAMYNEASMVRAWNILMESKGSGKWPRLERAVFQQQHGGGGGGGGFPFVAWYGDFKGCNYRNWIHTTETKKKKNTASHNLRGGGQAQQEEAQIVEQRRDSIPIFTVCGRVNCPHGFPMPTYKTLMEAQEFPVQWDAIHANCSRLYPVSSKIRKVVWRGTLSGDLTNLQTPRLRLGRLVAGLEEKDAELFDVGIVSVPHRHGHESFNVSMVGGLVPPIRPQQAFQRYAGILDIDGNSWSSRFGSLLCYNSVVLKVEPEYVDYFHLKYLKAWKHYIPVKSDLSDLVEKARFVADPQNDATTRRIVRQANEWCRSHMVQSALDEDLLDIWEQYVVHFISGNNWTQTWWPHNKDIMFRAAAAGFDMRQLTKDQYRHIFQKKKI